jgi:hypothetical protein
MNEAPVPRRGLKRFSAAFAGFVTIVALSIVTDVVMHTRGIFPPPGQPMSNGLWLLAAFYRLVYGVLGCYIAARLAPDRPLAHAMVLGILGTALGVAGTLATWGRGPGFGPPWYPIAVAVMPIPCAWIGAALHTMRGSSRAAG